MSFNKNSGKKVILPYDPNIAGNSDNLYVDTSVSPYAMYYWDGTNYVPWGGQIFKELNQWHVDKNGNDTTGAGSDENPYLTISKALSSASQADAVIVNEGTYSEAITISTQNLTLRGQGQEYGGLTEVNSIGVTANGTSVRVSSMTSLGVVTHSGTSPLYLADMTVKGNYTSSSTAYTEIKNSRLQDGTISKTAAGILFIQDSLIGNATFSTANSVISLRNVTIDPGKKVTIGSGVIYSMQDVVGEVEINALAIPLETALLAQGGTSEQSKAGQTSNFNMLRMLDPDTQTSPTTVVTFNPTTKRLETSPLNNIKGDVYKTTSTTCQDIVSTGNITFTVGTGLAYTPLQDIIVYADANNHMHGEVVSYNSVTGELVMDVHQKSGSGNYCNWTVNLDAIKLNEVSVYFGTTNPNTSGVTGIEGDLYYITSNGTNTGTVSETYVYDGTTWVKVNSAPKEFSNSVFINTTNPSTATIFDLNNPPTTNDNTLKANDNNIYIASDGSTWNYNTVTGTYSTYVVPANTEWYFDTSTVDAGGNKTSGVWRSGNIGIGGFALPTSNATMYQTSSIKGLSLTGTSVQVGSTATGARWILGVNLVGNKQHWFMDYDNFDATTNRLKNGKDVIRLLHIDGAIPILDALGMSTSGSYFSQDIQIGQRRVNIGGDGTGISQSFPLYNGHIRGTIGVDTLPTYSTATQVVVKNPSTQQLGLKNISDISINVLTTVQPTPSSTGNTTNLNTIFKDSNDVVWTVDSTGDAIQVSQPNVFSETVTQITQLLSSGHLIGEYINEAFQVYRIYETVTSLGLVGSTLRYTDENGNVTNITIPQGANVTFGTTVPTATANEGDEYFITSDGTVNGTITAQYIYDATSSKWVLRPTPVAQLTTTSLLPRTGNGTNYVNPTLSSDSTLVDVIQLADGTRIRDGKVTWTGHGLPIHTYFFASATAPFYTATPPTSGYSQQLFYTDDANTILIDIEEGVTSGGSSQTFAKNVYVNANSPTTATIFDTNNPPTTNDNSLKADDGNLYIGTDGSTWTYNTSTATYSTYVIPSSTKAVFKGKYSVGIAVANSSGTVVSLNNIQINSIPTAWNNSTGTFTAPTTGYYLVTASMGGLANWNTTHFLEISIVVNGVVQNSFLDQSNATFGGFLIPSGSVPVYLTAGSTLQFRYSGSLPFTTHVNSTYFSISQL
jgi:hypothetical protein